MNQVQVVFWNVNRRSRNGLAAQLAHERKSDIVIVCENGETIESTENELRSTVDSSFLATESETPRLHVFAKNADLDLNEIYGDKSGRLTIRRLRFDGLEFLLVAVHLVSKLHWDESDQLAEVTELARQIRRVEREAKHSRTILVGDLNMNPFERGVAQTNGLHAVMTRDVANQKSRVVQGREYPFFYNPMWGCFGDRTPGAAGTHHYRASGHLSYDWNMFDQVLWRPDALAWFREQVEIVTRIGDQDLLTASGRPDRNVGSDHLPLCFELTSQRN